MANEWSSGMNELPNDSDGNALRQLEADGSDLSRPMAIDFAVAVPSEETGRFVAEKVSSLGFKPDVYYDVDSDTWTCYCTKTLVPTHDAMVAIQKQLEELGK